jgi:putative endonuclease
MYFLYILECSDHTFYTGITTDLGRRIDEHNNSPLGARYTRGRRPVKMIYLKKYGSRGVAQKEEARIKKLSKKEKMELIRSQS